MYIHIYINSKSVFLTKLLAVFLSFSFQHEKKDKSCKKFS